MDWTIIGGVSGFVMSGLVTVWVARLQNKGRPEHALIDQLQEQIESMSKEKAQDIAAMKRDIADLKLEQRESKRREAIRDNYINKLRRHIEDGNPPPPPEWPEGLYD